MQKQKQYPEEIQILLKSIVDDCNSEDQSVRERQLRVSKRLKLFWEGFTRVWYSEVAHDWRIWGDYSEGSDSSDQAAYDKSVNIFRAYLESIIAALSILVPPVKCYPDDADNTLDLSTAKAGDKIAALLDRHNNYSMLWLHSLFVFCTEGMVACYNYTDTDKAYGTYKENQTEDQEVNFQDKVCTNCGHIIDSTNTLDDPNEAITKDKTEQANDEFDKDESDVPLQNDINSDKELCPNCLIMMNPDLKQGTFITTKITGQTEEPKARVKLEVYGLMNIKVPVYARRQSECAYLKYSYEEDYAFAMERYDNLKDNENLIKVIEGRGNAGAGDQYDAWARLSPQYQGEFPTNVVTRSIYWIRPAKYNYLRDEKDRAKLKKRFPFGVRVELVNDTVACCYPECLDDHWTLTFNPLSDYIHFDPLGLLLASVQEITTDLLSLTLQTIEHGVGLTFVDPAIVDLKAYEQTEVVPGALLASKPIGSNKKISDGFFELKTANLSGEVLPFFQDIQNLGQLVSGALPSLFGGSQTGAGGDTASGYSMSRAQAQQRLQTTWKMLCSWWKEVHEKAIPAYIKCVKEDEKEVQTDPKTGGFINVFIRKADLEGKIGKIELEANENIPMTWGQRKDLIMQLLQSASPQLLELMNAPENREFIYDAIGLTDMFVPGEDDREKQLNEIKELLNSSPIPTGVQDPNQGPPEIASVEIDPDYDDHKVQFEICRQFIISEYGQQQKVTNPEGYHNVLLHGKAHLSQMQNIAIEQAQQAQLQDSNAVGNQVNGTPPAKPNQKKTKEAPITGEADAPVK